MYLFKADTTEQLRDEIVEWLRLCASQHRRVGRIAVRKTAQKEQEIIATTYLEIANFIQRSSVQPKL